MSGKGSKSEVINVPKDRRRWFLPFLKMPGFYQESQHVGSRGIPLGEYLDFDVLTQDPVKCEEVIELLAERIEGLLEKGDQAGIEIDCLGFLEKGANTIGALKLAGALSVRIGIPHLVIRFRKDIPRDRVKANKGVNGHNATENSRLDQNILLVTDHVSSGSEILAAVKIIEGLKGRAVALVTFTLNPDEFRKSGGEFATHGLTAERVAHVYTTHEVKRAFTEPIKSLVVP